jgi:very-long-chain (3R)-3-hydroxyacyl-CoA dehydratase
LLAVGWAIFLIRELANGFAMDTTSLLLLNICQGAAVLEIVHVAIKWVKSPLFTTFIQVVSRVFVLVFINIVPREELIRIFGVTGVALVTVAWGITEVVRYSYYSSSLLGKEISILTYLRYTLFIILYPIGVCGEWLILLSVMKENNWELNIINIFMGIVLLTYIPFFPKLYMYMWNQRGRKIRSRDNEYK